ncbi:MarR family transcriptional regulator [bacterium]|nr:MarR family transcriptional regulator [bacterium]
MGEPARKYPSEFLGFWVHRLRSAMYNKLEEHASQHGVTGSEILLMTMLRFKGESSLVEIANIMGLAHPSVLRTIDSLEKRGFVERKPHPSDRRVKLVTLTEKGCKLETKVNRVLLKVHKQATHGLSEQEVTQFFDYIRRAIINTGGPEYLPPAQVYPPDQREHAESGSFHPTKKENG